MKSNSTYLITLILALFFGLSTQQVLAQGKDKKVILEKRKVLLQDEIEIANKILKETKLEHKSTIGQVQALNQKIIIREKIIRTINREVKLIEEEIEASNAEIDLLEKELEVLREEYAKMLITAYINRKSNNALMYILASESMEQAFKRIQYMKEYAEFRQKQGQEILDKQEKIKQIIAELNQQKTEKEQLLTDKNKERALLQSEKNEQEKEVAKLIFQEKDIAKQIAQKQQEVNKLAAEIEKIIKEELVRARARAEKEALETEAKKLGLVAGKDFNSATPAKKLRQLISEKKKSMNIAETPESAGSPKYSLTPEAKKLAAGFSANKGNLPWPVEKGILVGKFGKQPHPVVPGVIENRAHIEIASEKNSDARAVYSGTVSRVFGIKGAGLSVIVSHGNYFTVYSNLSSVYVKQGQEINTKQKLGKIYTNPENNQTVLNFGVWLEMKEQDPEYWLFKR